MPPLPPPDPHLESDRPLEFRSTTEEVAVGTLMGCLLGSIGSILLGGFVGAIGAAIGDLCGGWSILGGSVVIGLVFWLLPVTILISFRPLWLYLLTLITGAAYLFLIQSHIHQRDLGTFYPWILTALPLGIVLGTFFEPIRLARGGSTKDYVNRGVSVAGGLVTYGNKNAMFLMVGFVLGLVAEIVSFGRQRIGATIGGVLGGGVAALATSSVVAWRGDVQVAGLFFGSVWNIAWACTALGGLTGALSGWWAALIRERQEERRQRVLEKLPN